MKWRIVLAIAVCACVAEPSAFAHRIDEYLQATLLSLQQNRVQASMRMIPGMLVSPAVIAAIDANGDGSFSEAEKREYAERVLAQLAITVDGGDVRPTLASWSIPQPAQLRDGVGEIHIDYFVDLPHGGSERTLTLENRHFRADSVYLVNVVVPEGGEFAVVRQKRNEQQSMYQLDFHQVRAWPRTRTSSVAAWLNGLQLSNLFRLGMRHIAEGADHLLFLLTLLLPAPLLASNARWIATASVRQSLLHISGIVTAFTVGHSMTLTLAALRVIHVPGRPVEVLIAVSIFVSAIHALRPVFPGREAYIAGFFGLIHGLAFAATLDRLGLARWDRVAGIVAFNLGIEAMQMIVVATVLPSLMLMRRTRAYAGLRIAGASFAGVASVGWIVGRVLDVDTPVDLLVNGIAHHAAPVALALLLGSVACRYLLPELSA